jgi:esterase/lipase superfamily enzyme
MAEFLPAIVFGVIVAAVVLIYLIVWFATRRLSTLPRVLTRLAVAVVLLSPVGLLVLQPHSLEDFGGALSDRAPAPERKFAKRRAAPPPSIQPGERVGSARPPASTESRNAGGGAPPPQPPEKSQPNGIASRSIAPGADARWDVVPVFYGTDRNKTTSLQRISYTAERAKRLELGRALVTVPKVHQVPVIERPWVYKLPFTSIVIMREKEDPAKHFTLKELTALSEDDFIKLVRTRLLTSDRYKDQALIFVHGFNTSFDFAVYRAAQLAYDLKFDGASFVYSWPSRGEISPTAYSYDRESAEQAEPHLRKFLELVAARSGAKSVSIIAHSLGNKLLLNVLRDLQRTAPAGVKISQVILAAPDVDRDGFEFLARNIRGVSSGVTMYAASNDRALEVSREFWGGVPRAGDVPSGGPVVVEGVDTIDVTATSTEIFSLNHSGYAEKSALLNDIELLLKTGERPPEKRIPILQRIKTVKGDYWRYPG